MVKKASMAVAALIVVAILAVAGCGEKEVKRIRQEEEGIGETLTFDGHLDNPEWGGAQRTQDVYEIDFAQEANVTEGREVQLTRLTVNLRWVDDHSGTDSQDVTDPFMVNITVGNVTVSSGFRDTGQITLTLPNNQVTDKMLAENTTVQITVYIGDCGTYAAPPFIFGRLVRYYDTGNDYTMTVDYSYLEVWYETKNA